MQGGKMIDARKIDAIASEQYRENLRNPLPLSPAIRVAIAKLDASLSTGSSCDASLWEYDGSGTNDTTVNITAYDWMLPTGTSLASGTKVVVVFCEDARWYVVGVASDQTMTTLPGYSSSNNQILVNDGGTIKYINVAYCHVYNYSNLNVTSPTAPQTVPFNNFHIKEIGAAFSLNAAHELTVAEAGDYEVSLTIDYTISSLTSYSNGIIAWIEWYDATTTSWKECRNSKVANLGRRLQSIGTKARSPIFIRATAGRKYRVRAKLGGTAGGADTYILHGSSTTAEEKEGCHWHWNRAGV